MKGQLASSMQSALVFAARYAHGRNTGAPHVTVCALKEAWPQLSDYIRTQIISESHEALHSLDDWEDLRTFAREFKP